MNELSTPEPSLELAPQKQAQDLGALLAAVVQGGDITPEKVALAERLLQMKWQSEERDAKTAYTRAMVACQKETGKIVATREIRGAASSPGSMGALRSRHANLEDIQDIAAPILDRHGFCVSFRQREESDGKTLVVVCVVSHSDGHAEEYPYRVGIVAAKGGNDEAQASTKTNSYGKRVSFCNAFNIRIDTSDDAFSKGPPIPGQLAASLEERARFAIEENPDGRSTELRLETLAKRAGVQTFAQIPASKVEFIEGLIEKLSLSKPAPKNSAASEAASVKPTDPDLYEH